MSNYIRKLTVAEIKIQSGKIAKSGLDRAIKVLANATKLPSEAFAEITEEAKKIAGEIFVENGKELIFEGVTGELSMGYFHIFANYIEEGKKTSWVASNI